MPALAELEAAWLAARARPGVRARSSRGLLRDFAGRPTPLYLAERLSEAAGREIWLKREDLDAHGLAQAQQRARPGAARPADGQDADHRRDRRRPARRRERHRLRAARTSSASSTWAPRTSAASSPTSSAWSCSARASCRVEAGARTLKEAVSEAIRDWVTNVATTHYIIGSAVGPAPYPAIVRDLQRVIGDEARAQLLERAGRLPDRVDRVRRRRLERDRHVRRRSSTTPASSSSASRPAGEGLDDRPPRRAADRRRAPGRPARLAVSAILQDDEGQILEAHSISAGLDYPGSGPEHAWLRDTGRARYVAVTDDEALARSAAWRGSRASSRRSRPPTRCTSRSQPGRERARRGLPVGPRRQGPRRGAGAHGGRSTGVTTADRRIRRQRRRERIAAAFARLAASARGADALPDGRLPGPRRRRARSARPTPTAAPTSSSSACRSPTRSPTGRSSRPPARARCAAGATVGGVLDVARGARGAAPGRAHVLREPRPRARRRARSPRELADAGASGLIVPDLPLEEAPAMLEACDAAGRRARAARRADDAGRAPGGDRRAARAASSTPSRSPARPGERARCRTRSPRSSRARTAAHGRPVALGFGIATPEHAAAGGRRRRRRRDRRQPPRARGGRGRRAGGGRARRSWPGFAAHRPSLGSAAAWALMLVAHDHRARDLDRPVGARGQGVRRVHDHGADRPRRRDRADRSCRTCRATGAADLHRGRCAQRRRFMQALTPDG